MAAQWADFPSGDVGLYGTNTSFMTDGIWGQVQGQLVNDPDPNVGAAGKVFKTEGGGGGTFAETRKILTASKTVVGMSGRVWVPNVPASTVLAPQFFSFHNGANVVQACAVITPTGSIQILKGMRNLGVVVGETDGPVVTANAWTHISIRMDWATDEVTVEKEGVPVLTLTGVDIGAGPCAQVAIINQSNGIGASTPLYVKDLFIWDGDGTVNNDHPGPVTVYRRAVDADVSSGWTSTGATDFGVLDESPPDDADYISADDTLPAPSIMELLDLPDEVVSVRAVCMVGRMRKTDGGDCKVQMSLSPNTTDWADGSDRPITTAATFWFDWSELSPDTGFPWTPIEFNAAEIKINRTL